MTTTNDNLNLEIYEFILNEYSSNSGIGGILPEDNFYTTYIKSVSKDTCGYISDTDDMEQQKPIVDTRIRSCDSIDGTIKNMDSTAKSESGTKPKLLITDVLHDMSFNLDGISSDDLIKYSHIFNTKNEIKDYRTKSKVDIGIKTMARLYDNRFVSDKLGQIEESLLHLWTQDNRYTHTYIKILRPSKEDKFIIMGDFHGSYATFIRILLRLRKMEVFNNECIFNPTYHLVFLGDLVDRGVYGYEIVILIFLLKLKNPNNIHINNGNHEEEETNNRYGFKAQIVMLFNRDEFYLKINNIFKLNHSALLIENPNITDKYVYLAHGGHPVNTDGKIHSSLNTENMKTNDNIFIPNNEIDYGGNNSIRWNDFHGKLATLFNDGRAWIIGTDNIRYLQTIGIDLTIRGHQDQQYNTKLIEYDAPYNELRNINDIFPEDKNKVCYGYTHKITLSNTTDVNHMLINNKKGVGYIPVITISTNTDFGRDLTRDSFTILKFIEEFNPEIQGCVEANSEDERTMKDSIRRFNSHDYAPHIETETDTESKIVESIPDRKRVVLNPDAKSFSSSQDTIIFKSTPDIKKVKFLNPDAQIFESTPETKEAEQRWRNKYLKYKHKYLELKRKINKK